MYICTIYSLASFLISLRSTMENSVMGMIRV